MDNDKWVVVFMNRGKTAKPVKFDWQKTPVTDDFAKRELNAAKTTYKLRNLWTKKDLGTTKKAFKATISKQDVVMLLLSK